jgi:hypothetical protein
LPHSAGAVAATFDNAGVEALVRWAQAGDPDYSYAAFSEKVKDKGCAGYIVSFLGAASSTTVEPLKPMSRCSRNEPHGFINSGIDAGGDDGKASFRLVPGRPIFGLSLRS